MFEVLQLNPEGSVALDKLSLLPCIRLNNKMAVWLANNYFVINKHL